MKQGKLLVLFCLISLSCTSTKPSTYFGRIKVTPAINSNCGALKDGVMIDATNFISVSSDDYNYLLEYFEDKELRLYKCLKFNRCK